MEGNVRRVRFGLIMVPLLISVAHAGCKQSRIDDTYDHGNYIDVADKGPPEYGQYSAEGADRLLAAKWAKGDRVLICDEGDHRTIHNLSKAGQKIKVVGLIK